MKKINYYYYSGASPGTGWNEWNGNFHLISNHFSVHAGVPDTGVPRWSGPPSPSRLPIFPSSPINFNTPWLVVSFTSFNLYCSHETVLTHVKYSVSPVGDVVQRCLIRCLVRCRTTTRPTSCLRSITTTRPTSCLRRSAGTRHASLLRRRAGTRHTSHLRSSEGTRTASHLRRSAGTRTASHLRISAGTRTPSSRVRKVPSHGG